MPTAFVTGGTGFLGSNLVSLLKEEGWQVIAMHRGTTSADRLTTLGAEPRSAELDDVESLKRAMPEGVDAVFHVAASISWWRFDREQQERVNVGGTRNVAEAALAKAIEAEVEERRPGWDGRVAVLAGELQARRLAASNVVALRRKR